MAKSLNASVKVILFAIIMIFFLIVGVLIRLLVSDLRLRRMILSNLASYVSRFCLWSGRIKVLTSGLHNIEQGQNYLVVANHMGMLDILALLKIIPSIFVTSVELRESPIVGWLTEAGGCVYVERRNRANIHVEVQNIQNALIQGNNVVVFPEAKSTNGDIVHPFKKSLFVSCAGTQAKILPVTINYLELNGKPVTAANRDYICWYGDQPFHEALWRLMSNFTIKIELIFHPSLVLHTADDRRQVAEAAHSLVQSRFVSLNR